MTAPVANLPVSTGKDVPASRWARCFSSLGCPELSLRDIGALAREHDVPLVELRTVANRLDLPAHLAEWPGGWEAAARDLGGVRVQVLSTSFRLTEADGAMRKDLLRFAELAEALHIPWLRVFGGGIWGRRLEKNDFHAAADQWRWWAMMRAERKWKVQLLLETHDAFSASAPCLRLFKHVGRSIPLLWDSHHTWRLGGESPQATWAQLGDAIRHVHLKDSVAVPSARHPFTYVLPGEGEMPIRDLLDLLARVRFGGAVSLEWERQWHPYLCPLDQALKHTLAIGGW